MPGFGPDARLCHRSEGVVEMRLLFILATALTLLSSESQAQSHCLSIQRGSGSFPLIHNACRDPIIFTYWTSFGSCSYQRRCTGSVLPGGQRVGIYVEQNAGGITWISCWHSDWSAGRCRLQ